MSRWEDVWSFSTARFTVTLSVADEEFDPADSFERPEDVEFAREGGWHWFQARVQVTYGDENIVLGRDYLGGCSYLDLQDFIQPGEGYFRDMVREAVAGARRSIAGAAEGIRA